ncbi:MAG: 3-oxoacyl-[acyl-carrier protein] reductase, partial [uncultured Thermomicrobiales bacterium]
ATLVRTGRDRHRRRPGDRRRHRAPPRGGGRERPDRRRRQGDGRGERGRDTRRRRRGGHARGRRRQARRHPGDGRRGGAALGQAQHPRQQRLRLRGGDAGQRGGGERGGLGPGPGGLDEVDLPRRQVRGAGDRGGRRRRDRQYLLGPWVADGAQQPCLRGREVGGDRDDPADGDRLRAARHPGQCDLPGAHPHRAAGGSLGGKPRGTPLLRGAIPGAPLWPAGRHRQRNCLPLLGGSLVYHRARPGRRRRPDGAVAGEPRRPPCQVGARASRGEDAVL